MQFHVGIGGVVLHKFWFSKFERYWLIADIILAFCPKVKKKWQKKLPSITHVDGTARVQTVTKEQNKWLYDLLTLFKEKTGVGVLLNTSFNLKDQTITRTPLQAIERFIS